MLNKFWNRFLRDDKGKIVIWQWPNIPLIIWALFTILSFIFSDDIAVVFSKIASISLIIWAILELLKGVNYFRRLLGLVILLIAVKSLIT